MNFATTAQMYRWLLAHILAGGEKVHVRGLNTLECLGVSFSIDQPGMLTSASRSPNIRFMIAEGLWIIDGNDDLESLTRYNQNMEKFSDDGLSLAGAYGPRIMPSMSYIYDQLGKPGSRQAVVAIWTNCPWPSKDIPCTLTLQFMIRKGRVHTFANMRSSDAWLGIPYDAFSFAMIGNEIADATGFKRGPLHMHLASSHLYSQDWERAIQCVEANDMKQFPMLSAKNYRFVLGISKSSHHCMERINECLTSPDTVT